MGRNVELLLTETVDGLGIVGDLVSVKTGYARNYLLPRAYATTPSEEAIAALAEKRKSAEALVAKVRSERESMVNKLEGFELNLQRSCNDSGMLYGSVSQRDIAVELTDKGFAIKAREVRLPQAIKRVDSYDVPIKLDLDLEATIKVWVVADRELPTDEDRVEMEFDNEGNLIEPSNEKPKADPEPSTEGTAEEAAAATAADQG